MTIRQCFEACLVELDKVQAPSLLLEDFNYLFNKAIQKCIESLRISKEDKNYLKTLKKH